MSRLPKWLIAIIAKSAKQQIKKPTKKKAGDK